MTKYQIIYADPPWDYKGQKQHNGKGGVDTGGALTHYPTMTLNELKLLRVVDVADEFIRSDGRGRLVREDPHAAPLLP